MRRLGLVFATLAIAAGQQPPAALPSWLIPYGGAKAETQTALANRIEVAYSIDARPDLVVAHYRRLLEAAGLPFLPSFDGIGTSMRAAAAECDLLIKVREQGAGTLASVSCAAKPAGKPSSPDEVKVITNHTSSPTKSPWRLMEERIREGEEYTRKVLAEAEARHKQGIKKMETYDQPVDGRARKKEALPTPKSKSSPSWLRLISSAILAYHEPNIRWISGRLLCAHRQRAIAARSQARRA